MAVQDPGLVLLSCVVVWKLGYLAFTNAPGVHIRH